jgi:hypothetical protein
MLDLATVNMLSLHDLVLGYEEVLQKAVVAEQAKLVLSILLLQPLQAALEHQLAHLAFADTQHRRVLQEQQRLPKIHCFELRCHNLVEVVVELA